MSRRMNVGIMAPSSVVPAMEFEEGTNFLRESGFNLRVHDQVMRQHFTFAGNDEDRAGALFEYAMDPQIDIVWCARGGYGATRLLPILDRLTAEKGKPATKLLIGYSDITVLHEYARREWG